MILCLVNGITEFLADSYHDSYFVLGIVSLPLTTYFSPCSVSKSTWSKDYYAWRNLHYFITELNKCKSRVYGRNIRTIQYVYLRKNDDDRNYLLHYLHDFLIINLPWMLNTKFWSVSDSLHGVINHDLLKWFFFCSPNFSIFKAIAFLILLYTANKWINEYCSEIS